MTEAFDFAAWNEWVVGQFREHHGHVEGYEDLPLLLLSTTGAKTSESRLVPVVYMVDGGRYVVFAVNGGRSYEPAWYRNLVADPHAIVEVGDARMPVVAHLVVAGQEHAELWRKCLIALPSYDQYVGERSIPAVVLEPDGD